MNEITTKTRDYNCLTHIMKVRNENNELKIIIVKGLGFRFKLGDWNIIQVLLKG